MRDSLVWSRAALIVLTLLLLLTVARWNTQGPAPRGNLGFSALRAHQLLTELWPEQPHPVGSPANRQLRDRLRTHLQDLGLETEIQTKVVCNDEGFCSQVDNILAWIEGGPDTVMLSAHYDSVPAGPGAADDGSGVVTVLELARRFVGRDHPPRNTILFLLEDGEEAGLLGAKAFAGHARAASVKAVVNLEARGSSGASMVFETHGPGEAVVDLLGVLPKPVTSSLFSAVYGLLPSKTSFAEHAHGEVLAFNLAFLDEVATYHTPHDTPARLDPRSLQHQGDSALALMEALAARDFTGEPSAAPRAWFDWLGLVLIPWPHGLSWLPALIAFLVLSVLAAPHLRFRRDEPTMQALRNGICAVLTALPIAMLIGMGQTAWRGSVLTAYAHLTPLLLNVAVFSIFWTLVWWHNREPRRTFHAVWLLWAATGLLVSLVFPQAAYLPSVPALAASVVALLLRFRPEGRGAALDGLSWLLMFLPAVIAFSMLLPLVLILFQAVGSLAAFLVPAVVLAGALLLWPLLPRAPRSVMWAALAATGITGMVVLLFPLFHEQRPQPMSMAYVRDGAESAWWIDRTMAPLPGAVTALVTDAVEQPRPPLPFLGMGTTLVAPAPASDLVGPTWTDIENAEASASRISGRLQSQRGAAVVGVLLPPETVPRQAFFDGVAVTPRLIDHPGAYTGYRLITFASTSAEGVLVTLDFETPPQQPLKVFDLVYDVPRELAAPLMRARGAGGTPAQNGDFSLVIQPLVR